MDREVSLQGCKELEVTYYTQMVIQLTDLGGDEVRYGSEN